MAGTGHGVGLGDKHGAVCCGAWISTPVISYGQWSMDSKSGYKRIQITSLLCNVVLVFPSTKGSPVYNKVGSLAVNHLIGMLRFNGCRK